MISLDYGGAIIYIDARLFPERQCRPRQLNFSHLYFINKPMTANE